MAYLPEHFEIRRQQLFVTGRFLEVSICASCGALLPPALVADADRHWEAHDLHHQWFGAALRAVDKLVIELHPELAETESNLHPLSEPTEPTEKGGKGREDPHLE